MCLTTEHPNTWGKLIELWEGINEFTVIVGYFNTPLSVTDISSGQKIGKAIEGPTAPSSNRISLTLLNSPFNNSRTYIPLIIYLFRDRVSLSCPGSTWTWQLTERPDYSSNSLNCCFDPDLEAAFPKTLTPHWGLQLSDAWLNRMKPSHHCFILYLSPFLP